MKEQMEMVNSALERKWWQSKKFAMWLLSFLGLGGCLGWSLHAEADWKVSAVLAVCMTCVSMVGILGQAFVDAIVRGVRAWRGTAGEHWGEAKPK